MHNENETDEPPRKKRGPYKKYLLDPTVPVPRTTIFSRNKGAGDTAAGIAGQSSQVVTQEIVPEINPAIIEDVNEILDVNHEQMSNAGEEIPHLRNNDASTRFEIATQDIPTEIPNNIASDTMNDANQDVNASSFPDHTESTNKDGGLPIKNKKSYVEKHHLTDQLHKDSPMSKLDALLMILHLSIRHCNTQHFIEDQIKFVNALLGENVLDVSYHVFSTLFKPTIEICRHYICLDCDFYLGSEKDFWKVQCPNCNVFINEQPEDGQVHCVSCEFSGVLKDHLTRVKVTDCPKCKKKVDIYSTTSDNYFITLPLREQIEELLRKPGLKLVSQSVRPSTTIADVFDGEVYKKLSQAGHPLSNENALTVVFNTDGVAVHKSTSNSLWPIQLYINEIIPEQRLKRENLIVAGLWFGKKAPNMSLYLKPFLESILNLSMDGVNYKRPDGIDVKCPVYPLLCSVDSVAKPKLLCQKQFNAKMGCLYCYHPNDCTIGDNRKQRYYDQTVNYELRCEDDVIRDMLEADRLQREGELRHGSVNGFLGISILTMFSQLKDHFPCNTFHIVWGVAIDYMHAALEGVTSDLFNIYENILSANQLKTLDDYIKGITPPQGMTRRPRSFSLRPYWKAKEFRAVVLFYALPCLQQLLPSKDYVLLKHYVTMLHTLLSDQISAVELSKAASSLSAFTEGYQKLYGLQNVSYNLHICRHLIDMVIQQGPLWCYSNFVFESGNGYLVNLIRGTKSVVNEIAKKHSMIQTVSKFIMQYEISPKALSFCGDIMNCRYSSVSQEEFDNVIITGSKSFGEVSTEELALLIERNVPIFGSKVQYFNRVVRNGIVYCCKSYSRSKVYDDSCVLLFDNTYAVVDKIVKSEENKILCLIKPIRIAQGADLIPSIKTCCNDVYDSSKIIPFEDINRKCLFVVVGHKSFVCLIPNFYERD